MVYDLAFRAPSISQGKCTLMPAATFDAFKLLISNEKRNRQEAQKKMKKIRKNSQKEVIENGCMAQWM